MSALDVPFAFTAVATSDFGQGIDLITGQSRAFAAAVPSSRNQHALNNATTSTQIVASQDDYSSLVDAVVQVQGSTLTGSFSAGASLLVQSQMSESSFSLVIGATVQTRIDAVFDPSVLTLTEAAAAVLQNQGPTAFQNQYGTHVIAGFIYGGEYFATINIAFQSVAEQEAFSASASASISEGLARGSVSAQISQALASSQSEYSLNSYVSQSGNIQHLNSADADSLISACSAFTTSIQAPGDGGRRMVALGYPWSAISQVRQILQAQGQLHALDISVAQEVADVLRKEMAALDYLSRTAATLSTNSALAPAIAMLASRYGSRISSAQQRIAGLQLSQVSAMDLSAATSLCQSPTLRQALAVLAQNKVPLQWSYALDGAFTGPILNGTGSFSAALSGDPQWIRGVPHGNNGQVATVGVVCNSSGSDGYVQAAFDWNNPLNTSERGRWFGDTIDLASTDFGAISTARWPSYNWNLMNVWLM